MTENGEIVGMSGISPVPMAIQCNSTDFELPSQILLTVLSNLTSLNVTDPSPYLDLVMLDILRYNTTWSACERQVDSFFEVHNALSPLNVMAVDDKCSCSNCFFTFLKDF